MAETAPKIEWYMARDSQQYGPVSEEELAKLLVLGHLRPTDLVWRQGFEDWQPAARVFSFPPPPGPSSPAMARRPGTEQHRAAPTRAEPQHQRPAATFDPAGAAGDTAGLQAAEPAPRRRLDMRFAKNAWAAVRAKMGAVTGRAKERAPASRLPRLLAPAVVVAALIGGGWFAIRSWDVMGRWLPLSAAGPGKAGREDFNSSPFTSAGDSIEAIDEAFQQAPLWRRLKQSFPDWYAARVQDVHKLKAERRDDAEIARQLAKAIAELRRKHTAMALSASPDRLKGVARSFLKNLETLSKHSVEACYGFISQGEMNPAVLPLILSPQSVGALHRQLAAVFDAVADGQKSPQTHLPARRSDYDLLVQELTERGWSQADLTLFSNPQALGQATPTQVCKLVQEWFAAHIALKDPEAQTRLLVLSLRPVVGG